MMESENGFGAGIESPEDDPFAGTSASEFDQGDDPLADPEQPAAEQPLPVVDKEGNPVEVTDGETQVETPEEQEMRESAEAELAEQEAAAPLADPTPGQTGPDGEALTAPAESTSSEEPGAAAGSEVPAEEVGTGMAQAEAAQGAAVETVAEVASEVVADPPPADDPASSATPTSAQTTQPSPVARDAAAPAESPGDAGPTSASATQIASTDNGIAPMPEERKDKSGAITHRRYVILTPEANGKHKEVSWYEDKTGKMVKKGTPGSRKQAVALATGQDQALGIGYQALGSPEGGVSLRAVALTYWGEVVHVEPEDQPIRQRLKFRR